MIYYFTPYSTEKDLGKCYNQMMSLLPNEEDYACFTDGDSMFTTHNFGHQLQEIVETYPEVPLFTCITNRVGTKYQCVKDTWDEESMAEHWKIGKKLQEENGTDCIDITNANLLSGVLMLIRKKEWIECGGFQEGKGMLGIDNSIHYRMKYAEKKVYLMTGIYVMHYYRDGNQSKKDHLL
jgi:GT2 family glycosyltransferase